MPCPCGLTRRAFAAPDNPIATTHLVEIREDAAVHYHKRLTEIYVVLEGEGHMELDGEAVPVRPMSAVLIHPGCRHRAVGKLRVIVFCAPRFDPEDEWLVEGKNFLSRGKITPFEDMRFRGKIIKTLLRGQVVYDSEAGIQVNPGYGRWLRRD